jgi:hypothetical protein
MSLLSRRAWYEPKATGADSKGQLAWHSSINRCADPASRLATAETIPWVLREIALQFFLAIPAVDKIPHRHVSDFKGIMVKPTSLLNYNE